MLSFNLDYFRGVLFSRGCGSGASTEGIQSSNSTTLRPLLTLRIDIEKDAKPTDYPHLDMDESYSLSVASPTATLRAATVWGAIRGLEIKCIGGNQKSRHRRGGMHVGERL